MKTEELFNPDFPGDGMVASYRFSLATALRGGLELHRALELLTKDPGFDRRALSSTAQTMLQKCEDGCEA